MCCLTMSCASQQTMLAYWRPLRGASPFTKPISHRYTATRTVMATATPAIVLTDSERQLFDTLLASAKAANLSTTLRCAGGWVRDKLLGKNSPDIDIALDDMYGKEFAEKVNEYLSSQGVETRTVAVIQVNPDQSKHLETARLKIHGMWIDLVNLRSESYAAGSRIPTMEFGTPEQDALRRDFTINSLFYNLNSSCVEDLTGKGLEDLRTGLLRTPLPPMETFLDGWVLAADPLRVLRAIRFAARFSFRMEDALVEAASTEEVWMSITCDPAGISSIRSKPGGGSSM